MKRSIRKAGAVRPHEVFLMIRSATTDDAGRLLEIYAYYVKYTAITFECDVPSPDEFRERIEKTLRKYPYLVLEEDGNYRKL